MVTGTSRGLLEELAQEEGWAFLPFPDNIGGRFSVLSPVGLFPWRWQELISAVWCRALKSLLSLERKALEKTPPSIMRQLETCSIKRLHHGAFSGFDPRLQGFFKWWIQLFAESEGKEGMGILPLAAEYTEELHSLGQYVQEGPRCSLKPLKIESTDLDLAVNRTAGR